MQALDLQTIITAVGAIGAIVLLILALAGPSSTKARDRRLESLRARLTGNAEAKVAKQYRRALAARQPKNDGNSIKQKLELRLARAGSAIDSTKFMTLFAGITVAIFLVISLLSGQVLLGLFVAILIGGGTPYLYTGKLITKRQANFIKTFPVAIDLLVRGLRSGLPVTETLGIVAKELDGPVAEEFRLVTERMAIGRTMDDAMRISAQRLSLAEFDFFCITLAIQRETGGNLAETLNNLANVLRSRAAMKLKVKAMASEGKASAYIVGALPFVVFGLIMWIDPTYMGSFFVDDRLIIIGIGGLVWMSIGGFIMAKMINFEI